MSRRKLDRSTRFMDLKAGDRLAVDMVRPSLVVAKIDPAVGLRAGFVHTQWNDGGLGPKYIANGEYVIDYGYVADRGECFQLLPEEA